MYSLYYTVFVLFGLYQFGNTIMCYECNSAKNSLCNEAILPSSLKRNCSELDRGVTHTLCRKIVQYVDHEVNGQQPSSRIIRSCGWDDTKYKGACYHRSGYGGRQEVCSCTTNYCNSSTQLISSTMVVISIVAMTIQKHICE